MCFQFFLLQLVCVAVLLDCLAKVAVLQILDSGLHLVQQFLQLCDPLTLLSCSAHVLLNLHSDDTQSKACLHLLTAVCVVLKALKGSLNTLWQHDFKLLCKISKTASTS